MEKQTNDYQELSKILENSKKVSQYCLDDIVSALENDNISIAQKSALFSELRDSLKHINESYTEVTKYAESIEERAKLGEIDSLSGLYRKDVLELYANQIATKIRKEPVYILFFDLNNFKKANDTMGHTVGDEALRTCGTELISNISIDDVGCRYGGDELVVIPKNIYNDVDAKKMATRLTEKLNERLNHYNSHYGTDISISTGIGRWFFNSEDIKEGINKADSSMYDYKKHLKEDGIKNIKIY